MKNVFLLSFLILIFGCSDDDEYPTIPSSPSQSSADTPVPSDSPFEMVFTAFDSNSKVSCPGQRDAFYLIADNSYVSGEIENIGRIRVSETNTVEVSSNCYPGSDGIHQSFSGEFTTDDGQVYRFYGSADVNTESMLLNGSIMIISAQSDYRSTFIVTGIIHEVGLVRISGSEIAS